jgi:hypothetical protein
VAAAGSCAVGALGERFAVAEAGDLDVEVGQPLEPRNHASANKTVIISGHETAAD